MAASDNARPAKIASNIRLKRLRDTVPANLSSIVWTLESDYSASWKQAASLGTLAATGHVSPNRLSPSRRISKADA